MKHHDLRGSHFLRTVSRVIELSTTQLFPIAIGKAIRPSESFANVRSITPVRSLFFLFAPQNRPIHHRTISNHFFHPPINRAEKRRRPAKATADHKNLISPHSKPPPKRHLSELPLQSLDHLENVYMRRSFQKFSTTLPRAAIARIKDPISLSGKEFGKRLLARNRWHAIAQNNRAFFLRSAAPTAEIR